MRGIPLGVALVVADLYLVRLEASPLRDPPEGFHAAIAREMARGRDWITPRIDGAGGHRLYSNLADRPPDVR